MKVNMNKTLQRIIAWILLVTINTLLFFGGSHAYLTRKVFPNGISQVYAATTQDKLLTMEEPYAFADSTRSVKAIEPQKTSWWEREGEAEAEIITDDSSNVLQDFFGDTCENIIKDLKEETSDLMTESQAASRYADVIDDADAAARASKEAANFAEEASKSGINGAQGQFWKAANAFSKVLTTLNIANDADALMNLNGENETTKTIESIAIGLDMAIAIVTLLVPGVNIPIAVSIAIGLFATIMHNKRVTSYLDEFFDNWDIWWQNFLDSMPDWMKMAFDIMCYKPNIYIYPTTDMDVSVTFQDAASLTTVIPDYSGSWDVHVNTKGDIYTKEGYQYDYLFYECQTNPNLFQTEEGFAISADDRKAAFEEILTSYGFTEEEINDFTEFWCDKLDENTNYVMYPQETELVDNAMAMDISPAPDTCVRMWFVFEECNDLTQPDTKTPVITPIERIGYTVIEWGGMIK